jgi:hypothetical protein
LVHVDEETPDGIATADNATHELHEIKGLVSTLAGECCEVCMPIRYENKWAIKKRFTQLQRASELFALNPGQDK